MASCRPARRLPVRITALVLAAAVLLPAGMAAAADTHEAELFAALNRFDGGDRSGGLEALYQVTARYPDFLAAHLIQAALLRTEDLPAALADLASAAASRPGDRSPLKEARNEAHARLSYWFDRPPPGHLPEVLVAAAPDRAKVVAADAGRTRLYLFERSGGGFRRVGDWYASIGKGGAGKRVEGDERTPLGVYFVTMQVAGRHLPPLYGAGALGLNYPNGWDRKRRRTGYGIWIHGEPQGLKSRAPRWSNGCLTVSNPALATLAQALGETSVPVLIGDRLRWLAPAAHERLREEWLARIERLNGRGAAARGLGIYGYPVGSGEEGAAMVLVEHRADGTHGGRWWQYWREDGRGRWGIAHEGPASFLAVHRKGLPRRMPKNALRLYAP